MKKDFQNLKVEHVTVGKSSMKDAEILYTLDKKVMEPLRDNTRTLWAEQYSKYIEKNVFWGEKVFLGEEISNTINYCHMQIQILTSWL